MFCDFLFSFFKHTQNKGSLSIRLSVSSRLAGVRAS